MTAADSQPWAARAGTAERAVRARHLRALWWLPGTRLGVVSWPAAWRQRLFLGTWHYWWQAHLLDCLLDAQLRAPAAARRDLIAGVIRGIRLRNGYGWINVYYDDIAWLGLALQRAAATADVNRVAAIRQIIARLRAGCSTAGGGGIWWRKGDDIKNVPATGPAAILLARSDDAADQLLAAELTEWIMAELVDPSTGLVWDGLRVDPDGSIRIKVEQVYSYCQGVYLGACVELGALTGDQVWLRRAGRTVSAVAEHLVDGDGVLGCSGGGDGGLFTGILCRYLALAAIELPATEQATRRLAARLVLTTAQAAWRHRSVAVSGPVFGDDWSTPTPPPPSAPRDLSVQLSGWMLCEAAALVERRIPAFG
ncbi:MAG TPA: glycoside hydrolase family 76 protein [Pseudonocardiaceae bacterium]